MDSYDKRVRIGTESPALSSMSSSPDFQNNMQSSSGEVDFEIPDADSIELQPIE